jgi:hypothetical protein
VVRQGFEGFRFDRVKFRTETSETVDFGTAPVVSVLINGTDLIKLWGKAGQEPYVGPVPRDFLGPGFAWWSSGRGGTLSGYRGHSVDAKYVPEGYVPVLFCSCGVFPDGGAIARIVVEGERVVWTDFETVQRTKAEGLGPFTFRQDQYEYSLSHTVGTRRPSGCWLRYTAPAN